MNEETGKAQDAPEITPPDAPLVSISEVAASISPASGGAALAARQRKQMLLISGIVLVLLAVVVALTSTMLSSPKKAIQKAFVATVAERGKRMERVRAEVPMVREVEGGAQKTDVALTFRGLQGDLPDEVRMAAKLLEGMSVSGGVARDPASGVAELDAGLALGAARLIGGYLYASPELIAAGSPDFSDMVLTVNPKTFAADAKASPLYESLGLDEEQLAQIQESLDAGLRALTEDGSADVSSENARAVAEELNSIFATMTADARYEKVGREGKATLYRVTVAGEDVKTALLAAMQYLYFESPLSEITRTAYETAPLSDASYEEYFGELLMRLQADCPALPMELHLTVDKIIQAAELTVLPANAGSIAAPFDEIWIAFAMRDDSISLAAEYTAYLSGMPVTLLANYDQGYADGVYRQSLTTSGYADEYLNASLDLVSSLNQDGACDLSMGVDWQNGMDPARMGVLAGGNIETSGDKAHYDFPAVDISVSGAGIGELHASFAVKADVAPLTVPYTMQKPATPLFSMDSAALDAELGKYRDGANRLVLQFLQLLYTGNAA